ncbi:MAG TPA: hypothetical protein VNA15_10385 [Candidatus Angelobacter sp.]|nr:hypothetical protein [Candidatus Angelobacter sp.]
MTGTNIAVGNPVQSVSTTPPNNSSPLIIVAGVVAAVVVIALLAAVVLKRRRQYKPNPSADHLSRKLFFGRRSRIAFADHAAVVLIHWLPGRAMGLRVFATDGSQQSFEE